LTGGRISQIVEDCLKVIHF